MRARVGYASDVVSVRSSMSLYFALLAVSVATVIWMVATDDDGSVWMDIGHELLTSGLVLAWCVASWRYLRPVLKTPGRLPWHAVALIGAVVLWFISSGLLTFFQWLGFPVLNFVERYQADQWGIAWALLLICVQPAVIEELAFRGVILTALMRPLKSWEAVVVTAMIFAVLHLSVPSLPHLFMVGVVAGWLRVSSGSIYPCMGLHFTYNLLSVIVEWSGGAPSWWLNMCL